MWLCAHSALDTVLNNNHLSWEGKPRLLWGNHPCVTSHRLRQTYGCPPPLSLDALQNIQRIQIWRQQLTYSRLTVNKFLSGPPTLGSRNPWDLPLNQVLARLCVLWLCFYRFRLPKTVTSHEWQTAHWFASIKMTALLLCGAWWTHSNGEQGAGLYARQCLSKDECLHLANRGPTSIVTSMLKKTLRFVHISRCSSTTVKYTNNIA